MCHNDIPARMSSTNNVFYIIFNKKKYIENGMECQETQKSYFYNSKFFFKTKLRSDMIE